jgi:hypothetical protein
MKMQILKVRNEELKDFKNFEGVFVYWKHPRAFAAVKAAFGTYEGKVGYINIVPVANWRQFKTITSKNIPVYVLADQNSIQSAVLNGNDNTYIVVDLSNLDIASIPQEVEVIRMSPDKYVAENPDAVFVYNAQSIQAFDAVLNIPPERKRYYSKVNEAKFLLNNENAVLVLGMDVPVKQVLFSALFRPVPRIRVLIPPKDGDREEVDKVIDVTDLFE